MQDCLSPPGPLCRKSARDIVKVGRALSRDTGVLLYLKFPFHEEIRMSRQAIDIYSWMISYRQHLGVGCCYSYVTQLGIFIRNQRKI
jgi:hypothetical protein